MDNKDQGAGVSGTTGAQPTASLRERAEAALRDKVAQRPAPINPPSVEAMQKALHDLELHQIELEIQNEELCRTLVELASTRERFFDFYDLAPVGYCTLGAQGLIVQVNLTMTSLLGCQRKTLIGQRFSAFIEPSDQDRFYRMRQQALAGGDTQTCELRLHKSDGDAVWVSLLALAAADATGEPQLRLVISDISEQRQREEQMRLQALVLDQIQSEVSITNLNGTVTYLNRAGLERRDANGDGFLGKHFSDYGDEPQSDATQQEIAAATQTQGGWHGRVVNPQADGSTRTFQLQTTLVRDESGSPVAMVGVSTDITRQLSIEQELRQREQYLRALLDNFPFEVWLKDLDGRYLAVNQMVATQHGWPSTQSLVGKRFEDVVDPALVETALEHEKQVIAAGSAGHAEFLLPIRGEARWHEIYIAPVVMEGHLIGTVGYSRDLSEQHAQDKQLRLQATVLDQIQDRVTITDMNGTVIYLNQAGLQHIELATDEQQLGQHVSDYGDSAFADAPHEEILHTTLTQGSWQGKVGHVRANGSEVFYSLRTTLVKDKFGTPIAMVGVGTDITRQLALENELRQRESFLHAMLDNFPFKVWLKDLDGRYLAVNQTLATLHGWPSVESLVGKTVADITDAESAALAKVHEQSIISSGRSFMAEHQFTNQDQRVWVETYKAPIVVDGKIVGTVGYSRDITERKQIDSALRVAKDEAVKANQAKSHFLAAASHDLRQPIFALTLFFGSLKNRVPPQHGELIDKIENCIESLSEMLTDLLDVSKLEAGVIVPARMDFSVDEFLHKLLATHSARAHDAGLHLRWRDSDLVGRSDPVLLGRIVGNLLDNAIRHTRKGGVLIACRRHDGRHWIEVWDTGIGIAPDKLGIIFEAFTRLDDDARIHGSGLGLAIVDKTAALLGLQIRVRSQPDRGSMFAIELPLGERVAPAGQTARPYLTRRLRIGLVEDDSRVRDALTQVLEDAGHELIVATSGKALIEALGRRAPDIIVSDYRLVGTETGYDVIEISRKIFGADLPALLITGDTDPALVLSMSRRGIKVLYKPLKLESLQDAIRDAVEARRAAKP